MVNQQIIPVFIFVFMLQNSLFYCILARLMVFKYNKIVIILIAAISVVLEMQVLTLLPHSSVVAYGLMTLCYCVITIICFEGSIFKRFVWGLSIPIHIFSITAVAAAIRSLALGQPLKYIFMDDNILLGFSAYVAIVCIIVLMILLNIVSNEIYALMMLPIEKVKIFLAIEVCILIGLISNTYVYELEYFAKSILLQQIILGVMWIVLFYMGLLIMIGIQKSSNKQRDLTQNLKAQQIYKNILHRKSDIVIEVDCNAKTMLSYTENGVPAALAVGQKYEQARNVLIKRVQRDDEKYFQAMTEIEYMKNVFIEGNNKYSFEYRVNIFGTIRWRHGEVNITLIDKTIKAIILINDITLEKELEFKAQRDVMTGLYNKVIVEKLVSEYLCEYADGVLFMIDIDNFKAVNDNLGHEIGDKVIKDVSKKLNSIFIEEDIIGRFGGDEFVVFVKKIEDEKNNIYNIAEKINKSIATTYCDEYNKVKISASIGISKVTPELRNYKDLYISADYAMYKTKKKGKDGFTIYSGEELNGEYEKK